MTRTYNVHEALNILRQYYITDSIQMVTRWLREERLKGKPSPYRKEGWRINHKDLFDFIDEMRPGLIQVMECYQEYIEQLNTSMYSNEEYYPSNVQKESKSDKHTNLDREFQQFEAAQILEQNQEFLTQLESNFAEMLKALERSITSSIQSSTEKLGKNVDQNEPDLFKDSEHDFSVESDRNDKKLQQEKDKHVNKVFNGFDYLVKEVRETLDLPTSKKTEERAAEEEVRDGYFNKDGSLKKEVAVSEQRYRCPFSGKESSQLRRMVKSALQSKLEPFRETADQTEENQNKNDLKETENTVHSKVETHSI